MNALARRFATLATGLAALGLAGCGNGGVPEVICEGRGEAYFAGIAKTSEDAELVITLTSAEPAPPANSYANKWTLGVTDAVAAEPVPGVFMVAAPYMVDHGHGAPNAIATEIGDGSYLVDPLSLKMNGLWDITIKATPAGGEETRAVFSFCVEPI
jgi:hypothetical protein